jgi:hypothetical protein
MNGYGHPAYAASFAQIGLPQKLPRSGGWIIRRAIANTDCQDGMGCYPLFACQDWFQLACDLDDLTGDLVSLTVVTDPFGHTTPEELRRCFPDLMLPFKQHFVADLCLPHDRLISAHHRRNARKGLQLVQVEQCAQPEQHLAEWVALYGHLATRRRLKGMHTFSPQAFAQQLTVPGMVMFRAAVERETAGMLLWYVMGEVAYYHLGAFSPEGYNRQASFALFQTAISYFSDLGLRWLNLGGGAGTQSDREDGLTRFKRGWASETRTAYLCGRILNRAAYTTLVQQRNLSPTAYFPLYRKGEF